MPITQQMIAFVVFHAYHASSVQFNSHLFLCPIGAQQHMNLFFLAFYAYRAPDELLIQCAPLTALLRTSLGIKCTEKKD